MARIAILPLPETGHVNAAVAFGNHLRAAGHEVEFCCTSQDIDLFDRMKFKVAIVPREETTEGPIYRWELNRSDITLVDSILYRVGIDAHEAGKKVVNLSTTFPLGYDENIPPVTTLLQPPRDESERAAVRAAWDAEVQRHGTIVEPHSHNGLRDSTLSILHRFLAKRRWPRERLDERAAINPLLKAPELILAPASLDFPRPDVPWRRYAGACINLRDEDETMLGPGIDERPLVYVSFGSQAHRYPVANCLEVVVAAARALPTVRFMVSTAAQRVPSAVENVVFAERVPQLAALRRASLMVSHGGLNGIKEALFFGVPLLVLPFGWDQPGNAARVAHHGLGSVLSWDSVTGEQLAHQIRALLESSEVRGRAVRFGERLRAVDEVAEAASALAHLVA
jgi:UDP:flavonoid glycosyltransferase YjiC (YdhE family)